MRILARFMTSASDAAHFPAPSLPEIAFLGRSNVGKSSVINSLVGTKLARTSNTPGRTRSINFFEIRRAGHPKPELLFTDLPGYGYAKVSREISQDWARFVDPTFSTGPASRSAWLSSIPTSRPSRATANCWNSWQRPNGTTSSSPPSAIGSPQTNCASPCKPLARNTPRLPSCRFPPKPAPAKTTSGPRSSCQSPTSLPAKVFRPSLR